MELQDRIAAARKAAGLTQEQLGERVGVTRQAVSKWESGQTIPDALTAAKLCESLHISADYLLLGREPEEGGAPAYQMPELCPCCGREVKGTICPVCGYHLPSTPSRGPRYAVTNSTWFTGRKEQYTQELNKYCGLSSEESLALFPQASSSGYYRAVLRRGLTDSAAQYITAHLDRGIFDLRIVEDCGEEEDALLQKPEAMTLPEHPKEGGIGFWGVVGAVIVALLILSIF